MASRRELVRRFVLNAICDDYENLDVTIARDVMNLGAECGLAIEREEVVRGLGELIQFGWAKAYKLDPFKSGPPEEFDRVPTVAEMENFYGAWFYITAEGMKAHLVDDEGWPFDEENNLRKGWTPPED